MRVPGLASLPEWSQGWLTKVSLRFEEMATLKNQGLCPGKNTDKFNSLIGGLLKLPSFFLPSSPTNTQELTGNSRTKASIQKLRSNPAPHQLPQAPQPDPQVLYKKKVTPKAGFIIANYNCEQPFVYFANSPFFFKKKPFWDDNGLGWQSQSVPL